MFGPQHFPFIQGYRQNEILMSVDGLSAYITAALEGMFPGMAVSSLPAFTVITISRCLEEMKLHSQLEGQPLWKEIHNSLHNAKQLFS